MNFEFVLMGGLLIGLASALLLLSIGRIAGISGIVSGLLTASIRDTAWRWAFVIGLIGGGAWATLMFSPPSSGELSLVKLTIAGLLVGAGTVIGSGCTSGHGVCGLGRLSRRSLVAVLVFMAAGMLTVTAMTWLKL